MSTEPAETGPLLPVTEKEFAQTYRLDKLRERWEIPPPEMVAKLPKGKKDSGEYKGCTICGGYHPPNWIHLDYVGHADVTRILIIEDPMWSWEPMAFDDHGLPFLTRDQKGNPIGLWIRLTIFGVSRIGYGSCDSTKTDPEKELIGDALRNAAMRFGIATKLWSKAEWDGAPEGRSGEVTHHAPGTSFDEALSKEQLDWRAKGWPAATHDDAVSHALVTAELKARILAMPPEMQQRIREFRERLNAGVWPPVPAHFDAIAGFLDDLTSETVDSSTSSEETKPEQGATSPVEPTEGAAATGPPTPAQTVEDRPTPLTMGALAKHSEGEVAERARRVVEYCERMPIETLDAWAERFDWSVGGDERDRRSALGQLLVMRPSWDPDVDDKGWRNLIEVDA